MSYQRQMQFYLILTSVALLVFLLSVMIIASITFQPDTIEIAHHNAPVPNNITIGNLNQDMVHNGFENMPEVINGNNNRAQIPWEPIATLEP